MNKYKDMEIKDVCCEDCLFDELLEVTENLKQYQRLIFIAKRELSEFIITSFITLDDYSFGAIHFDNEDGDYKDEYIITIDSDKVVWCEPAISKYGSFAHFEYSDIAYVYQGDVRQKLIDSLLNDEANVIVFGFEDEEFKSDYENDCNSYLLYSAMASALSVMVDAIKRLDDMN